MFSRDRKLPRNLLVFHYTYSFLEIYRERMYLGVVLKLALGDLNNTLH